MRKAWRLTVPSADSNLPEESDHIVGPSKNTVVIMKDGQIYKNTVK